MGETGTTTKAKALTRHRLCLIVPLAIQLSFPAILLEVIIVQWIRDDTLMLHPFFAIPYFLSWLASFPWLFVYSVVIRKELGKAAANWILISPFSFFIYLFLSLSFPHL